MSKTIDILKIIVLSLIIVILVGVLVFGLKNKINFNFETKKAELIYNENIEEEFNKINVDTKSLDVKFIKSEDEKVNVKIYDKKDSEVTVKVENNTLNIYDRNDNVCIGFCFNVKREIVVSLPEKEYNLIVNGTSSDVDSEINFNDVEINVKSGDIELKDVNDCKIKVTSGDVNIDNVDRLVLSSTSGDVELGNVKEYVDIETKSGDIDIDKLELNDNSKIKVISGDVKINNSSDNIYFNTKVKSGDVKINNNNRQAEYEINIETTSGDITVKN